jgi:hypothetical protein
MQISPIPHVLVPQGSGWPTSVVASAASLDDVAASSRPGPVRAPQLATPDASATNARRLIHTAALTSTGPDRPLPSPFSHRRRRLRRPREGGLGHDARRARPRRPRCEDPFGHRPQDHREDDGSPEGYAVEEDKSLFFTNLEDEGGTVVIDVKTDKVKATWAPGCGPDGPRGIAFDEVHNLAFVACTDHVQVLDAAHDGAPLGKLDAGAGIDNIDYIGGKLYVAAGKAKMLSVATVDDKGKLAAVATGETSEGRVVPSPTRAVMLTWPTRWAGVCFSSQR